MAVLDGKNLRKEAILQEVIILEQTFIRAIASWLNKIAYGLQIKKPDANDFINKFQGKGDEAL